MTDRKEHPWITETLAEAKRIASEESPDALSAFIKKKMLESYKNGAQAERRKQSKKKED